MPRFELHPGRRLLAAWAAALFCMLVVATFTHEVGHGVSAKLDGVHISTGFNRVGNPGRRPGDHDFRENLPQSTLSEAGGPLFTLLLALCFTAWLLRRRHLDVVTVLVAAGAVGNGLLRLLPMGFALSGALMGRVVREDEVMFGVHFFGNTLWCWLPPAISIVVSLGCLYFAYKHLFHIAGQAPSWQRGIMFVMPASLLPVLLPILDWLDRTWRLNW